MNEPSPCGYCPLQHARVFFPEGTIQLVASGGDPDQAYRVVRRFLCKTVAAFGRPCDPATCAARLTGSHPGALVNACKAVWADYYARKPAEPDWLAELFDDEQY